MAIDGKGRQQDHPRTEERQADAVSQGGSFFFLLKKTFENGLSDKSVYLGKYTLQEFVRLTKEAYHDSEKELEMAVQLTGYALGRDYTYKYSYTHNPSMTIIQKE